MTLIDFIKHLQQKMLEEIMGPNDECDNVTCHAELKKVEKDWVDTQGKEDFEVHEMKGMFDEDYIRGFVHDKLGEKALSRYRRIWGKEYERERSQYQEMVNKAREHDQPNTWTDIAITLNQRSVKCQGQVLMVMGLTGGPCHKCFSIWHATKNHNRKNCKRCGRMGHFSRDCKGVQMILSEEECKEVDMMAALDDPYLGNPDKSCYEEPIARQA